MTGSPVSGFYQLAATRPERPAIIDPDGNVITFGALAERVNRISRALRAHGPHAGDRVAAIIHNGPEYLELVLATAQTGLLLVPVNWRLTTGELSYIVQDSGAKVLIADAEQATALPVDELPERRYVVNGELPGWQPYDRLGAGESAQPPEDRRSGAVMMYTSGTTGQPKGVRNALPAVDPDAVGRFWAGTPERYGMLPGEGVHLVVAPLYHAAPGNHAVGFLHAGHTVVIDRKFDAERTLRLIERYEVTSVHLVPTHFHRMLRLPDEVRQAYDLGSRQAVIHAGAPCPAATKRRMIDWLGPVVWEYLGATEGVVSIVDTEQWLAKPGTVGRPVPGLTVRIIDEGAETPTGRPGTIYFGTEGTPPRFEYHNAPGKTAASRHGDLVTVGDYGYLDEDGYLFLLDRRTDLIISGGVNIYPAEIEQHLITHPAVHDVAVIGVPDPEWGQRTVAVVQPELGVRPGADLAERLARHCADGLAAFKRPRRFEFVAEFPRTETGKVQRRVLREVYLEPVN